MDNKEYLVTQRLPDNGEIVLAYGRKTYCCVLDADEETTWHKVCFTFRIGSYKLKKELPKDPEETILEYYTVGESWDIIEGHYNLIGVTKWKKI